jgi:uncharacterized protein DUF6491
MAFRFRSDIAMKIFAPASLALIGAVFLAAAGAAGQPAPANAPPARPFCFWTRSVANFAAVDTHNLYLRVDRGDVYQLKMFGNCLDISWVHHIALRTRSTSNVCEGRNPDLDVFNREVGIGRQRCPVLEVRKLTPDEVAALPKGARP